MAHPAPGTPPPENLDPRSRITGHAAVRAAAKDWHRYSSDLQGDRDVRNYRQLPLEADPPRHGAYRDALQPMFTATAIAPHQSQFTRLARGLIDTLTARGGGDIVTDLALPYVVGCLTLIMGRPQDYDEWLSWGPDLWTAQAHACRYTEPAANGGDTTAPRPLTRSRARSGDPLHAYLDRVLTRAENGPSCSPARSDIWDRIAALSIDGSRITRDEMFAIGSVLLAGGRDTVSKLITGLVWHVLTHPEDRHYLTQQPQAIDGAVAELARYLSPLPGIERLDTQRSDQQPDQHLDPSTRLVVLDFASANHDPTVWEAPHRVDLRRPRAPHLAFGFGHHSCLGKSVTEHEARAFLTALLDPWPGWRLDGDPDIHWTYLDDQPATPILTEFLAVRVVSDQP
jgi:cytochrome P450